MDNQIYKTIRVFSRQKFNNYIKELNINDTNIENKDICIIEFFNSDVCEDVINRFQIEDEFNYRQGWNSRPFKEIHNNVMQIICDDILGAKSLKVDGQLKSLVLFRFSDAIALYNFIIKNQNKKKFIVHCSAGISRSGAAGEFLKLFFEYQGIKTHFPEYNNIRPNGHILGFLRDIWNLYNTENIFNDYTLFPNIEEGKKLLLFNSKDDCQNKLKLDIFYELLKPVAFKNHNMLIEVEKCNNIINKIKNKSLDWECYYDIIYKYIFTDIEEFKGYDILK